MSEYREFTGKSVEEALRAATDEFGVAGLQDLDFEILTQGSRGVLGMGAEPARIIAAPKTALGGSAPRREAAPSAPTAPSAPSPSPTSDEAAPAAPASGAPGDDGRSADGRTDDGRTDDGRSDDDARSSAGGPARSSRGGSRSRASGGGRGASRSRGSGGGPKTSAVPEGIVVEAKDPGPEPEPEVVSDEALAAGKEILEQLVELMGYEATVETIEGPTAKITVYGSDDEEKEALGALIGRKGERLSALQHLVNLMLSRKMGSWTRVLVDVEDYRGRRERQLAEVAQRAAERVRETGQMLQLEPMTALERRWVHLSLRDEDGVTTQSIGEEPDRRVVVLKT